MNPQTTEVVESRTRVVGVERTLDVDASRLLQQFVDLGFVWRQRSECVVFGVDGAQVFGCEAGGRPRWRPWTREAWRRLGGARAAGRMVGRHVVHLSELEQRRGTSGVSRGRRRQSGVNGCRGIQTRVDQEPRTTAIRVQAVVQFPD